MGRENGGGGEGEKGEVRGRRVQHSKLVHVYVSSML